MRSKIRLYMMGYVDSMKYWGSEIPRLDHSGKHGRLTVRSVKIIADGACRACHLSVSLRSQYPQAHWDHGEHP